MTPLTIDIPRSHTRVKNYFKVLFADTGLPSPPVNFKHSKHQEKTRPLHREMSRLFLLKLFSSSFIRPLLTSFTSTKINSKLFKLFLKFFSSQQPLSYIPSFLNNYFFLKTFSKVFFKKTTPTDEGSPLPYR